MRETLTNKKTIFSTEHIGMNITETKTKEQTFTDLILGTEEIKKDTTETQDKTSLTTQ